MFEDIRRAMLHRSEAKEKERLRQLEKERKLSHAKTKQYGERRAAEESLSEQKNTELLARDAARQARRKRVQLEKELRPETPKALKLLGKALRPVPRKVLQLSAAALRSSGKKRTISSVFLGPTDFILGSTKKTSLNELMFGSPPPTKKKKGLDILE